MKRTILAILALLIIQLSNSQKISIDAGGLIVHLTYSDDVKYIVVRDENRPDRYKTIAYKPTFNRVVLRPQFGISYRAPLSVKYYYQVGIFTGEDCLLGPIYGATLEAGHQRKIINYGVIIGGYIRDGELWRRHYFTGNNFIPIVGINVTLKKQFKRFGIELSNKITPIMTIHNISLTYNL